mmetsp:Transcript_29555/g.60619  ORF Transcript_29555/g.60619 Transcript_29555/m.60619 type:complete len:99 (-) Transcript_29555:835-1131(-)
MSRLLPHPALQFARTVVGGDVGLPSAAGIADKHATSAVDAAVIRAHLQPPPCRSAKPHAPRAWVGSPLGLVADGRQGGGDGPVASVLRTALCTFPTSQ